MATESTFADSRVAVLDVAAPISACCRQSWGQLLANSNSNSGIGIGIELAFPSLTGIGIELELPVFELELNWNCHNWNWNWSRNCVLRNRIRNCFPWN